MIKLRFIAQISPLALVTRTPVLKDPLNVYGSLVFRAEFNYNTRGALHLEFYISLISLFWRQFTSDLPNFYSADLQNTKWSPNIIVSGTFVSLFMTNVTEYTQQGWFVFIYLVGVVISLFDIDSKKKCCKKE